MKSIVTKIALLTLITITAISEGNANRINYFKGSFEQALKRAKSENKPLIVKFYANWCVPCQWMDETVFSDPSVISKINEKYISLRVNIDDPRGFELKNRYEINFLPSLLFFSSSGIMTSRVEETFGSSHMHALLDNNLMKINSETHRTNSNPEISTTKAEKSTATMSVHTVQQIKSCRIQLGVFSNYENLQAFVDEVSKKMDQPMTVLHDYKGSSMIYRVLMGPYESTQIANDKIMELKNNYNINGKIFY